MLVLKEIVIGEDCFLTNVQTRQCCLCKQLSLQYCRHHWTHCWAVLSLSLHTCGPWDFGRKITSTLLVTALFMPPLTSCFQVVLPAICQLSVFPLCVNICLAGCDISEHSTGGFQWNLVQVFIMWVGIAGKVFKVRGQRSRSWPDQ